MDKSVLIIDDDRPLLDILATELGSQEWSVTTAASAEEALRRLARQDFAVVLTDLTMPRMSGVTLCRAILQQRDDVPVIVMTAFGTMETAIEAIRAGAYDFLNKPFETPELLVTLDRACQHRALREEVKRLRHAMHSHEDFEEIVGTSDPMRRTFDLLARVAAVETSVLISGESGTGKELVARAIHRKSARAGGPFVAINCAAMPETLLESELFGHVKGAFTDAHASRQGLFIKAEGGTLFLDEIGEMPAGMQAKLLRAVQERTVRPVGGDRELPFDARLITATNRDLETEVEEKRFREDLFYRINVVRIHVPPLRARGSDILKLAHHFLTRFAGESQRPIVGITAAAAEKLLAYPWPGNVRELQNCVERAVALACFDQIGADDLPEKIATYDSHQHALTIEGGDVADLVPMEEVARRYIKTVLHAVGGNKTEAARVLGFDRRTLYRKLDRPEGSSPSDSMSPPSSQRHPIGRPRE